MMWHWLLSFFAAPGRPRQSVRRLARLALEALEDRTVPASFTWKAGPAGATGNWNAAAKWQVVGMDANGIPDSDDDVIFNSTGAANSELDIANLTIKSLTIANTYSGS